MGFRKHFKGDLGYVFWRRWVVGINCFCHVKKWLSFGPILIGKLAIPREFAQNPQTNSSKRAHIESRPCSSNLNEIRLWNWVKLKVRKNGHFQQVMLLNSVVPTLFNTLACRGWCGIPKKFLNSALVQGLSLGWLDYCNFGVKGILKGFEEILFKNYTADGDDNRNQWGECGNKFPVEKWAIWNYFFQIFIVPFEWDDSMLPYVFSTTYWFLINFYQYSLPNVV